MNGPCCHSTPANESTRQTALGYPTFHCLAGKCRCHARSGPPFTNRQFPTAIVLLVMRWRLRSKWSLRDLAEMFLERGFEFTHEPVRDREARFTPFSTERLRAQRTGQAGTSWSADAT